MLRFMSKILVVAVIVAAAWLAYGLLLPTGPAEEKLVQVRPGSSAHHIAADLQGRKPLKAGEYSFDHPARLEEVYGRIARGDILFRTLVIPEGFNLFDIATAVESAGLCRREDFLQEIGRAHV